MHGVSSLHSGPAHVRLTSAHFRCYTTGIRTLSSAKNIDNRRSGVAALMQTSTITIEQEDRNAGAQASTSAPSAGLLDHSASSRPFSGHRTGSSGPAPSSQSHLMNPGLTSAMVARAANKSVEEIGVPGGSKQKVAYQGVPGAYSEVAACKACPDMDPLPCEQFEVAFQALTQWMADRAVLPIENSLGGSIHAVIDLLLRYRLHIVGETSIKINHCLVALPGTKKSDITRVMSHPQALAQVDNYLRSMGVVKEAVDDTAGAAQMVSRQQLQGVGAICSRRAAELYGLDIVEEGVQDDRDNITRFVVLSRNPLLVSDTDTRMFKTSIVFSLPRGPGQLFRALSVFALRDIDLTKIESRPLRSNPVMTLTSTDSTMSLDGSEPSSMFASPQTRFNYMFYVDCVGSLADVRVQNALRHLQETAPFMRVLGAYPMDVDIGSTSNEQHQLPSSDNGSVMKNGR